MTVGHRLDDCSHPYPRSPGRVYVIPTVVGLMTYGHKLGDLWSPGLPQGIPTNLGDKISSL
jgi:hypothetical protein